MSKIEVNQISSQCGSTLTIGQSGDTIQLACGATAAGFGSTGEVSWDTTKKTSGFIAVSGVGYFCDTTSADFTVTLPATPSAGNVVAVSDYAGTFGANSLTIARNRSNINGSANNFIINTNNVTVQFIYVDATQGWRVVFTGSQTGEGLQQNFITATGGTITCCGNYKIHTFTSPGTFTVSSLASSPANDVVDYLVVAGGGGGGSRHGGGGGAGGYRESCGGASGCYTTSPLANPCGALPVSATTYPVTVGGGGAGGPGPGCADGSSGSNSVFSTITSAAGGFGSGGSTGGSGGSGGGGGMAGGPNAGGSGNTPPTSPPQGNNGATSGSVNFIGGAGGGATAVGSTPIPTGGAAGGAGATSSINGTPTARAGGGGAGAYFGSGCGGPGGAGGVGGGGDGGGCGPSATSGSTNTGGGGGGGSASPNPPAQPGDGGAGGSGVVIIRYRYQ